MKARIFSLRFLGPSLALVALSACGNALVHLERPTTASRPIAFGDLDSAHTAVVALLESGGGGSFAECSGSIVQVRNGTAYVLTAAHCCNQGSPSVAILSNDYSAGENALFGGPISPPVFSIDQSSVFFDSQYDGQSHDFCMFKVPGVPANTPTLALPSSSDDGVGNGVAVEHVGFGVTDQTQDNTLRHTGTDAISSFDANTISYDQGGNQQIPGPCEGDSGGPALIPAGAPQSQQTVVATTSFGLTQTCGGADTGTSSRVASEIGPGGFITSFLNDAPIGSQPGQTGTDCNSCAQQSEGGSCGNEAQACSSDQNCINLSNCLGACQDQNCATQCANQAGQQAANELNALDSCVCNACSTQCAQQCGGTNPGQCNVSTGNATCDQCVNGSCCNEITACEADASCNACFSGGACTPDAAVDQLSTCLQNNCPCSAGEGEGEGEGAQGGEGEGAQGGEGEGEGEGRRATSDRVEPSPASGCSSDAQTHGAIAPWALAAIAGLVRLRRRRVR